MLSAQLGHRQLSGGFSEDKARADWPKPEGCFREWPPPVQTPRADGYGLSPRERVSHETKIR